MLSDGRVCLAAPIVWGPRRERAARLVSRLSGVLQEVEPAIRKTFLADLQVYYLPGHAVIYLDPLIRVRREVLQRKDLVPVVRRAEPPYTVQRLEQVDGSLQLLDGS